jgi:FtsZ-interacting cell division protein ZipA
MTLVPVGIVAIIAVTVLIIWLSVNRREVRKEELRKAREDQRRAVAYLAQIRAEAAAQIAAGNTTHEYTAELISDYFTNREI